MWNLWGPQTPHNFQTQSHPQIQLRWMLLLCVCVCVRVCVCVLLKPRGVVRKTRTPTGDRQCGSTSTQSTHTHTHTQSMSRRHLALGTRQTKCKPAVASSDTDKQSGYARRGGATVTVRTSLRGAARRRRATSRNVLMEYIPPPTDPSPPTGYDRGI